MTVIGKVIAVAVALALAIAGVSINLQARKIPPTPYEYHIWPREPHLCQREPPEWRAADCRLAVRVEVPR
jgi:hypothetical protein